MNPKSEPNRQTSFVQKMFRRSDRNRRSSTSIDMASDDGERAQSVISEDDSVFMQLEDGFYGIGNKSDAQKGVQAQDNSKSATAEAQSPKGAKQGSEWMDTDHFIWASTTH